MKKSDFELINASAEIKQMPDNERELAFIARQLVQATLPHKEPKGNPPEWYRTNGDLTLSIQPGYRRKPGSEKRECIGYPYGSMPRLLLFWITTEAIRTGSRTLELGSSLQNFMHRIGLSTTTGGGKRSNPVGLKNQMERLFKASISFECSTDRQTSWMDMKVTSRGQLWFDPQSPDQDDLFGSWIELGETFYSSITSSSVPLDMMAIRALRRSPFCLDLYSWLAHKIHSVNEKGKPQFIGFGALQKQFGCDFTRPRNFKAEALKALIKVSGMFPRLSIEVINDKTRSGLKIFPGRSAILPKH